MFVHAYTHNFAYVGLSHLCTWKCILYHKDVGLMQCVCENCVYTDNKPFNSCCPDKLTKQSVITPKWWKTQNSRGWLKCCPIRIYFWVLVIWSFPLANLQKSKESGHFFLIFFFFNCVNVVFFFFCPVYLIL